MDIEARSTVHIHVMTGMFAWVFYRLKILDLLSEHRLAIQLYSMWSKIESDQQSFNVSNSEQLGSDAR